MHSVSWLKIPNATPNAAASHWVGMDLGFLGIVGMLHHLSSSLYHLQDALQQLIEIP